jgi:hypothetical protein
MTGKTFSFEINRTTNAHAPMLFRLETDGARWSEWAKPLIVQSSWERYGASAPAGVGAVRKVGMWPFLPGDAHLPARRGRVPRPTTRKRRRR